MNSLWQIDALPARIDDVGHLGPVCLVPPMGSFIYRLATFPPDHEVDTPMIAESMAAMGGEDCMSADSDIPGPHVHDTLDIITILDGEIYAVLEATETLLRPGDTFVQRGTRHSWSNRTDKPATLVSIVMPVRKAG